LPDFISLRLKSSESLKDKELFLAYIAGRFPYHLLFIQDVASRDFKSKLHHSHPPFFNDHTSSELLWHFVPYDCFLLTSSETRDIKECFVDRLIFFSVPCILYIGCWLALLLNFGVSFLL